MRKLTKRASAAPLSARLLLSGAVLYLAACGQPSGANANPTTDRRATGSVATATATSTSVAPSRTNLPIEQGLYFAEYSGSCARADIVFFYDGESYGYILQALPGDRMNSPRSASAEIRPISRVATPTRGSRDYNSNFTGFTQIWDTETMGSVQGLKPTGAGRFIWREGSMSARQMEYDDTSYQNCAFSQLSSGMQAAVRQYRPQLTKASVQQSSPVTPLSSHGIGFPPMSKGFYAVGSSCARAIANFESDPFGLTFIDERKMLTAGMLLHEITKVEALGANRFRLKMRTQGEDGNMHPADMVVTLTGPSSFVTDDSAPPMGNHTHCPDNSVPRSIRDQFANYGR